MSPRRGERTPLRGRLTGPLRLPHMRTRGLSLSISAYRDKTWSLAVIKHTYDHGVQSPPVIVFQSWVTTDLLRAEVDRLVRRMVADEEQLLREETGQPSSGVGGARSTRTKSVGRAGTRPSAQE